MFKQTSQLLILAIVLSLATYTQSLLSSLNKSISGLEMEVEYLENELLSRQDREYEDLDITLNDFENVLDGYQTRFVRLLWLDMPLIGLLILIALRVFLGTLMRNPSTNGRQSGVILAGFDRLLAFFLFTIILYISYLHWLVWQEFQPIL